MKRFVMGMMSLIFAVLLFAQPRISKVYNIVTNDGRMLTIEGANRNHNALIRLSTADTKNAWTQQWAVADCKGDGETVCLINPETWMGMDQALTTTTKQLLTWEAEQTNPNQQFVIKEAEGGYLLGNAAGQYAMVQTDGHIRMMSNGTVFNFVEVECDKTFYPGASVRLKNVYLDQVIGTAEKMVNDSPLVMEDMDDSRQGQVWTIRRVNATSSTFILVNAKSGLAMDMAMQSSYRPLLWTANNTSTNQVVYIIGEADCYQIKNANRSSYYVNAVEKNSNLQSSPAYDANLSVWAMVPAEPPVMERVDWQNERVFGINKLAGHAAYMPYRNVAAVKADKARLEKAWLNPVGADWLDLNGTWKFRYVADADSRPLDFFEADCDVSDWDNITVPGCIEMQGYDRPMYVNVDYAFHDTPPYTNIKVDPSLTGPSPVGSYRRTFVLPDEWGERRTILHFDGLYSGAYIWVNGEKVGYTQGGNMDAEFDITPYVKVGENSIAVQVFRWTDGSYLEGQDMFHMSGIHRDVYLYSVPQIYIKDHVITADYSSGYKKVPLSINLSTNSTTGVQKKYYATVIDPNGETVAGGEFSVEDVNSIHFRADIVSPQMYSSETPTLYTIIISQTDVNGNEEMAFATKYGFCDVTFDKKLVYINGKREYFKGVNTQDTHPVTGRTLDVATMWHDLTMMKQANINMVRTSHYPRSTKMNDMMAYLGLYICDEADVECHKNWEDGSFIASAASWRDAMMDRWERLVLRDRNNPAVVMWSLGNESGNGSNFGAGFDLVHSMDYRPVHYEGASREWGKGGYTDIRSDMYPTRNTIRNNHNNPTQPMFYCEYEHAMGNSLGSIGDLWQDYNSSTGLGFYDSPNGIGGCIWDWVDQSIYEPRDILSGDTIAENGYPKYRSGYDFPGPHQGNFVNNGIISADRAWTPELTTVKAVYQYIQFTGFKNGRLKMKNRLTFKNTDDVYTLAYKVLRNGVVVEESAVELPSIQPGKTGEAAIPVSDSMTDGAEYTLQVEARLKHATDWAEANYPMATAEYMLCERGKLTTVATDATQPFLTSSPASMRTSNGNVNLTADGGNVKTLVVGGLTVIDGTANSPQYNDFFWCENDNYNGRDNGNLSYTKSFTINEDKTHSVYKVVNTSTKCNSTFTYNVYSHGVVDLIATFQPLKSDLRRIGFSMNFPDNYDAVEYYARGPWENYCDRMQGSYLQRVYTTIDDMYEAYAHPQSNGDHQDLRELRLVDRESKDTLVITTEGQVGFSLSRYAESQYLKGTLHPSDLVRKDYIQAHFDYMVRGVGSKSCGGETAWEQYRCPSSGTYTFTLRFETLKFGHGDGINDVRPSADVIYTDGVVTAAGRKIIVYDLGGAQVAVGTGRVSLIGMPHGIYLAKVDGKLYKYVR